ncbi:MAG: NAD(P)H-hydrate dehydratase, partial [Myxococcota bacterium]
VLQHVKGKSALLLGPGLSLEPSVQSLIKTLLQTNAPMVIDADGLTHLAQNNALKEELKRRSAPTILTPHPGEMGRLCGYSTSEVQRQRLACARDFAVEYQVFVVLKGAGTLVASPEGEVWLNASGHAALAKAGTGDVLAGMIAGFLAQHIPPEAACRLAVFVHGRLAEHWCQERSASGLLASSLLEELPHVLHSLEQSWGLQEELC